MPRAKSKRRAYSSHWSRNVRGFEDPDISTHTLLIKFEDLIGMAMGPSDVNTIDFNMLQRVLYVLAEQLNILERSVEFKLGVPGTRAPPRSGDVTSTTAYTDRRDLPVDQRFPRRHRRPHSRSNLKRRDDYSDIEEGEEIYRDEKFTPKERDRNDRGRPRDRDKEAKDPSRDRDERSSVRERDELNPPRERDQDDRVRSRDRDDRGSRRDRVRDEQSLSRETDKYDRKQSRDRDYPTSTKDRDSARDKDGNERSPLRERDKDDRGRLKDRDDRGSARERDRDRGRSRYRDDQSPYRDSDTIPSWEKDTDYRKPYRDRDKTEKVSLKERGIDSGSPFKEIIKDVCARNLYGPVKEIDIDLPRDKDYSARDKDKRHPLTKKERYDRDSPKEIDKEDRDLTRDKNNRGFARDKDEKAQLRPKDRGDKGQTGDIDKKDTGPYRDIDDRSLLGESNKEDRDRDDQGSARDSSKDKDNKGLPEARVRNDEEKDRDDRESKKWDKYSGDRDDESSPRERDEKSPLRKIYIDESDRFGTSPPLEWGDRSLSRDRFRDLRRLPKEIEKYTKDPSRERYKDKVLSRKKDKSGEGSSREKNDEIKFRDRVSKGKGDRRLTKERYRGASTESDSHKTGLSGISDRSSDEIGSSEDRYDKGPYKNKDMEDETYISKQRDIEEISPFTEIITDNIGPSREDDGYDRGSVKDTDKDDRDDRGLSTKRDRDDRSPTKEHVRDDSSFDRDKEKGDKEPSRERDTVERGVSRANERVDRDSSRDRYDKKSPREKHKDDRGSSKDRKREGDREDRGSSEDRDRDDVGLSTERDRDNKGLHRERDQDDKGLSQDRVRDEISPSGGKEKDDRGSSSDTVRYSRIPAVKRDEEDERSLKKMDREDKDSAKEWEGDERHPLRKKDRGPSKKGDENRDEIGPSKQVQDDHRSIRNLSKKEGKYERRSSDESDKYERGVFKGKDRDDKGSSKKGDRGLPKKKEKDDRDPSREDDMDDKDRSKKTDKTKKEKHKLKAARSSESRLGRASSVEVATLSDFEQLEQTVKILKDLTTPVPAPTLPDNEKLRADLAKGASLPEAMEALQVGARIVAAEQAIGQMTDIMTNLVSSGHLPHEVLDKVNEVKSIVEEIEGEVDLAGVKGDDAKRISEKSIAANYPETFGRKSKPAAVTLKTDTFPDMFPGTTDGEPPFDFGATMLAVPSSMTSNLVTGITHAELNDALKKFREDFNKMLNNMALRAATTADTAATGIKVLSDKFNKAMDINNRLNMLNSQINDYAEQLDGFEAGLNIQLSGFHDIMNEINSDLKAGLAQLKDANSNAETAAVRELTERYVLLTGELTDILDQHRHLTQYQLDLRDELRRLVEIVEGLREQKADRDEVLDGLRDKADSNRLAGLLKVNDFEDALAHLNFRLDVCDDKFQKQNRQWLRAFTELDDMIKTKAETSQLTNARNDWLKSIEELQAKVRSLASMLADPKAAVTTRKMLPDSKPLKKASQQALVRPAIRLPPIGGSEVADEECLYDWNLTGGRAEPYHFCHRACGGSHTLLTDSVTREKALQLPITARCIVRYSAAGKDGKLYNMEDELLPCVDCNQLSPGSTTEETGGGAPGYGAGDQGN